jgi:DNA-directed RNA polymerase specialized sigma24 family protein
MFKRLRITRKDERQSVESLFLAHYEQMRSWALHLTGHQEAAAEDLVHDLYVHLALDQPDFTEIENPAGYLFIVLRNLYQSQRWRLARGPLGPTVTVDFDSIEVTLSAVTPDLGDRFQILDQFWRVNEYACARKESSKAASVLILRFFFGYYPSEIAGILCGSRNLATELLRRARAEARSYLDDPTKLAWMKPPNAPVTVDRQPLRSARNADEVIGQLRRAIQSSRQGECLPERHLEDIYIANQPQLLSAALLGHIVSCPNCLDAVNRLLALPPLSDRHPPDMLGPDATGSKGVGAKPATGSGSARSALERSRRKLREVYEHDPQELRVAVNGEVIVAHRINAEWNEISLALRNQAEELGAEEASYIEVFSEQGVRLLLLTVKTPPDGAFEQQSQIRLSDGRTLSARLNFCGRWPHLDLQYHDPSQCALRVADCGLEKAADCGLRMAVGGCVDCGGRRAAIGVVVETCRAARARIASEEGRA